ncbi:hypothetical protein [Singulisphaera acidiphila]|uniref:Uncharacterized protein n=1 Tax=Singulisphaera acidiphila (strain ATCC BAA-1392 / DSM 18658 / VKM B-2454 / MOB10) TaxID=886293 RepID=L0DBT7_SINAD|nr:hypothetical protein [Singulisphaera acidiphila]AGA26320.1 hypothetical protein Sinac_1961 [Singulisphaera acidiphila DSM 18658]
MSALRELYSAVTFRLIRLKQILGDTLASGARLVSKGFDHVRSVLLARDDQGGQDRSFPGSRSCAPLKRVFARMTSPGALVTITKLYAALFIGTAIAQFIGVPWPLLILPLLVRGLLQIVLVVAVLGSWMSLIKVSPGMFALLGHLRVATAVGLFWLAGISFALGQAILPATRIEAAASAPAEAVAGPPNVARSTDAGRTSTDGTSGLVRKNRSARARRRSEGASRLA